MVILLTFFGKNKIIERTNLTVETVKETLSKYIGIDLRLKVNRGRNKTYFYYGKIVNLYPSVFKIETSDNEIQTYSYAEILCGVIKFALKQSD